MAKFQVQDCKLPVGADGKETVKVGQVFEAENLKAFNEKYPSLAGKVKRVPEESTLEVATPKKRPQTKPKS